MIEPNIYFSGFKINNFAIMIAIKNKIKIDATLSDITCNANEITLNITAPPSRCKTKKVKFSV